MFQTTAILLKGRISSVIRHEKTQHSTECLAGKKSPAYFASLLQQAINLLREKAGIATEEMTQVQKGNCIPTLEPGLMKFIS